MDVYTAIATRKSVRAFQDREVPEELLLRLLEAARLAPSACNFQEWRFVVVRNAETRKRLAIAANRQMFRGWDKMSSLLYFHNLLFLFGKNFSNAQVILSR